MAIVALAACNGGNRNDDVFGDGDGTGTPTTSASADGGATGGSGDTGGGPSGCLSDDDCPVIGLVCNLDTGQCVGCLTDEDCGDAANVSCNTATGFCVGCDSDPDCPVGTTCDVDDAVCIPGCTDEQPCPNGFACCAGTCADLVSDTNFCGNCETACESPPGGLAACSEGECTLSECDMGFEDCNQNPIDGCETEGVCSCIPGDMQDCYTDEPATMNVGLCHAGMQQCNEFGTGWGACENEVTPEDELCATMADEDCDGQVDEDPDGDGDGWTLCGGDCCDQQGPDCLDPDLVNPGAFEVGGNMVDDDCDGTVDNPIPSCDAGLASNSANTDDYARAIDLCQFTTANPPDPLDLIWGVIRSDLFLPASPALPHISSRSLRDGFGDNIGTQFGDRLAVMSSGFAADNAGDANPPYQDFQLGQDMPTVSGVPADWFAANGNQIPNAPGCPGPGITEGTAFDPVMLELEVRAPTNANSFTVDVYFFSAEYPEWVCTPFNDMFVALIDSTDVANPADKNIAIYDDGASTWPVGVNLVSAAAGLFTECTNGSISQCGGGGTYNGCTGTTELNGTGFDIVELIPPLGCVYNGRTGGGTGWLAMSGNVTPGETITLRFAIWDTGDGVFDSLVLLDNFRWNVQASDPGVEPE